MIIDITLPITPKMVTDAQGNEKKALTGHLGTHFDVMNKVFPLEYAFRKGIVFDVSRITDREIASEDIDITKVQEDMFVAFYTGHIRQNAYGTPEYFRQHPQLSPSLIEELVFKNISMIGIDAPGIRRGKEHTPADQFCADHGVFVIENLYNLQSVLSLSETFTAYTFPMNFLNQSGLPCRILAEVL
ncbi:MAG: cyclase family protein [Erysipelotrichaceae bacterium]|nr:cyclase family protein [Erysipelotrichaceae bacterium]